MRAVFTPKLLFCSIISLAALLPGRAAAADGTSEFIVGFNESFLKIAISLERDDLQRALAPILKSARAQQLATLSIGRLKRKVISGFARGRQQHLSLIGAKLVASGGISSAGEKTLDYLKTAGLVRYVEPNIRLYAFATTDDPDAGELWGLNNAGSGFFSVADVDINAPEAWDIQSGSGDAAVAVLDTGIDPETPDLQENIWINPGETPGNGVDDDGNGYTDDVHGCDLISFAPGQGSSCGTKPFHENYHGTHVAGTIGARGNNGMGVTGIAWQTKLVSIAFLDAQGSGSLGDMIEGIEYAVALKRSYERSKGAKGANIRVVNASFGHEGTFLQAEYDAVKALNQADILLVAAAGNGGWDGLGDNNDKAPSYPAGYNLPNVISVAAINQYGKLASFSNFGKKSVHIAAPGEGILSTVFNGGYSSLSGTSMAAPHVTGVAALMFGKRPELTNVQAKEAIIASAKDSAVVAELKGLASKVSSSGMLDAKEALMLVAGDLDSPPGPEPDPEPEPEPEPDPTLIGDLNSDGVVDLKDALQVLSSLGKRGKNLQADLNGDGRVGFDDLMIIFELMNR